MKKLHSSLFPLLVFALVTGCRQSQQTPQQPVDTRAADEATIRGLSQEWSKAAGAKELDKAVSVYADDARRLATGAPVAVGIDAIRKEWQEYFAMPGPGFSWAATNVEVARSGDMAYETGTCEFKTLDKNKRPLTINEKYVVVWKKQADGRWKVLADMDNPDQ